jgi:hypothetical protein
MAIKMPKNAPSSTVDNPKTDETTHDDLPLEMSDDSSDRTYINGTGNSEGLSLEELDTKGFNDSRDEIERKKINPPVGDWLKVDRWELDKRVRGDDCQPGDLDPTGRTIFNVKGLPEERTVDSISFQPTLFMRISPDCRYRDDGVPDMPYKLFIKAKDLYVQIHGEKVKTYSDLCNMLKHDEYIIRTMNGDNGPVILDIKSKERRRR